MRTGRQDQDSLPAAQATAVQLSTVCHSELVDSALIAFLPVAALLIAVPGPDVLLVIRNATYGRRTGLATAAGTVLGLLLHVTAATVGLSTLVAASATAFTAVKVVGAAYLIVLGVQALLASRRHPKDHSGHGGSAPAAGAPGPSLGSAVRQGLLTNALNPKVAVFFVAFLPQFVPAGRPTLPSTAALGAVFVLMTAAYLLLLVAATVRAATLLARPPVRRGLDRAAGVVFIGFGLRLATASR